MTTHPIAIRVRALRTALGWSQFRLAARADVSPTTVSNAERFGHLTPASAAKLAAALGCRPDDLLRRDEGER